MNFCYSGQIIALAQYFDKKQSIATSVSMMGIGVGMFFLSSLTEYILFEYGWRCSFILSAGLSMQIAVLGSLVFPLKLSSKEDVNTLQQQALNRASSFATVNKDIPISRSRIFLEKSLNDR
ncbi:hypothetical protein SK128_006420 [Halocaridina rubra]|uniref:Major facilitator superfamily (MFS) profile domain-containing protein n=1 Tax=Halocaridina rubra TaxID=373956 RepID=A0AAN8WLB9_HALRR